MEWTRKDLKEKAKFSVKSFYWKSVLAAFVLALVSGGLGGGSGRGSDNSETTGITGNGFIDGIGGKYAGMLAFITGIGCNCRLCGCDRFAGIVYFCI